jgi:hypothetical protein
MRQNGRIAVGGRFAVSWSFAGRLLAAARAPAQDFPLRPIRPGVAFPADYRRISHASAPRGSRRSAGKPVVIANRLAANTAIGASFAAGSEPHPICSAGRSSWWPICRSSGRVSRMADDPAATREPIGPRYRGGVSLRCHSRNSRNSASVRVGSGPAAPRVCMRNCSNLFRAASDDVDTADML